jgi:hypothetical protein
MIGASSVVTSQAAQANNTMNNNPSDPIASFVAVIIIGILILVLVYFLK